MGKPKFRKENYKCKPIKFYGQTKLKTTKFLLNKFSDYNFPVVIVGLPSLDLIKILIDLFSTFRSSIKRKNLSLQRKTI